MASEGLNRPRAVGRRMLEVESNSVLIATVALVAAIGIAHPDFLAWGQLKEVAQNAAYVGIIAAGMAFLISMREIDLSVGSMFGLSLIAAALLIQDGMNPWLGALIGIALGGVMGLINAILVQFVAIPAIVATLATLSMYRGLSLALSDGEQVTGLPAENSFFTFVGGDFASSARRTSMSWCRCATGSSSSTRGVLRSSWAVPLCARTPCSKP